MVQKDELTYEDYVWILVHEEGHRVAVLNLGGTVYDCGVAIKAGQLGVTSHRYSRGVPYSNWERALIAAAGAAAEILVYGDYSKGGFSADRSVIMSCHKNPKRMIDAAVKRLRTSKPFILRQAKTRAKRAFTRAARYNRHSRNPERVRDAARRSTRSHRRRR
jgi:hypothetical protein